MGLTRKSSEKKTVGFDTAAVIDSSAIRATIKDDVVLRCAKTGRPQRAFEHTGRRGEFLVTRVNDEHLGFSSASDSRAFTLSIDAAAQHIAEGRLMLAGALPKKAR